MTTASSTRSTAATSSARLARTAELEQVQHVPAERQDHLAGVVAHGFEQLVEGVASLEIGQRAALGEVQVGQEHQPAARRQLQVDDPVARLRPEGVRDPATSFDVVAHAPLIDTTRPEAYPEACSPGSSGS
jgi:hypothetical protein